MIKFMKSIGCLLILIAGGALLHCSERLAGAGSETTNGIVGCIRNTDDTPAPNTIVKLFPDDFNPVADNGTSHPVDTTDKNGVFGFKCVDSGSYSILARNPQTSTNLLIRNITVADRDSLTTVSPGNLSRPGSITADFSGSNDTVSGYLYLPGTDIFSFINDDGSTLLGNVPSGTISEVIHATEQGERRNVLRGTITLQPGDTVSIEKTNWKFSRRIFFNTTSTGAAVMSTTYDFPVLLRLNGENFNFQEASATGGDLLFAKIDNSPLHYEIERWDQSVNRAEIWVTIDSLFGNSTGQSIIMYWGNPDALPESQSEDVFDTADGFQGVWHLGDAEDSIRDATGNRYCGTSPDSARPSISEGIIGNCREFDGAASCVIMPNTAEGRLNFPQNGNYTVSAWVLLDTLDSASYVVLSKGAFQYYLWYTVIYQNAPYWEFVEYEENVGWKCPTHPAKAKEWVLLTGVCNGTSLYLFVNGEPADTTIVTYAYTEPRNTTTDFIIGRYITKAGYPPGKLGGFCSFDGKIDEVRIDSRSRSAEWIRLCYMNQRTDDRLVIFK